MAVRGRASLQSSKVWPEKEMKGIVVNEKMVSEFARFRVITDLFVTIHQSCLLQTGFKVGSCDRISLCIIYLTWVLRFLCTEICWDFYPGNLASGRKVCAAAKKYLPWYLYPSGGGKDYEG